MFDFPNSPTANQIVTGPNGATWQWDGVKWIASGLWQGAIVIVSDTAPTNPPTGALWWDSVGGQLYLNFQDPTSREWVIANSGGIPDAVNDGNIYARQSQQWVNITVAIAAAPNSAGRNFIHNARFNIQQRGQGPWTGGTTAVLTADRWRLGNGVAADTSSASIQGIGDPGRLAMSDESARNALQITFAGNNAAGAYVALWQNIEGLSRLSGRAVTVSFWATVLSGGTTLRIGCNLWQNFGTGGSPSAGINVPGAASPVISNTTWTRCVFTFNAPSSAGKTFGTNGDDSTAMQLWFSTGSTWAGAVGNLPVQSGTIWIYGMQLEVGSVATPLMQREPADDLALCQRYFFVTDKNFFQQGYATTNGATMYMPCLYPVKMRASPTLSGMTTTGMSNASQITLNDQSPCGLSVTLYSSAAGMYSGGITPGLQCSADI